MEYFRNKLGIVTEALICDDLLDRNIPGSRLNIKIQGEHRKPYPRFHTVGVQIKLDLTNKIENAPWLSDILAHYCLFLIIFYYIFMIFSPNVAIIHFSYHIRDIVVCQGYKKLYKTHVHSCTWVSSHSCFSESFRTTYMREWWNMYSELSWLLLHLPGGVHREELWNKYVHIVTWYQCLHKWRLCCVCSL